MFKLALLLLAISTTANAGTFPLAFWKSSGDPAPDASTKLLLHLNSSTIVDSSSNALGSWTTQNGAAIDGTHLKFGAGAYDGTGGGTSAITHAGNAAFALGSGDFAVDFWIYHGTGNYNGQDFTAVKANSGGAWSISSQTGTIAFNMNGGIILSSTFAPSINAFHHVEWDRCSGTLAFYLDGTQVNTAANSTNLSDSTDIFVVGTNSLFNNNGFQGWIDEFRISSVCRHSSNFTPPTVAY